MIIASFANNINAIIAKDLLQSAGIIANSRADSLNQLYPGATAVTLEVNEDEVDHAKAILQENALIE